MEGNWRSFCPGGEATGALGVWLCAYFSPLVKRDKATLFVEAESLLQSRMSSHPQQQTTKGPRATLGDCARRSLQMEVGFNPHSKRGCFSSEHALYYGDSGVQSLMIPSRAPPIPCGVSYIPTYTPAGSLDRMPSPSLLSLIPIMGILLSLPRSPFLTSCSGLRAAVCVPTASCPFSLPIRVPLDGGSHPVFPQGQCSIWGMVQLGESMEERMNESPEISCGHSVRHSRQVSPPDSCGGSKGRGCHQRLAKELQRSLHDPVSDQFDSV